MTATKTEPERIRRLRRSIIKDIPKFPNNRATSEHLEAISLTGLLVAFLSWQIRFIRQAVREVKIEPTASSDPRWPLLSTQIAAFLQKVKDGEDLTPHLSLRAQEKGFTPPASALGPTSSSWEDKDFLLNVMGLHHFHLGTTIEGGGHAARTNDVVFASVSRETFEVIGIFDHQVFENQDPSAMAAERERLWDLYTERQERGLPPGSFIMGGLGGLGISSSGHSTAIVLLAQRYARIIEDIDPKLNDFKYLKEIFGENPVPKSQKFTWRFRGLDLCALEEKSGTLFILKKGPN